MGFLKKVAANSGSAPIGARRNDGVEFNKDGTPKALDQARPYPWSVKDKDGLPDDNPDAPQTPTPKTKGRDLDEKSEPKNIAARFLTKVLAKTQQNFFPDLLATVKKIFPDIKMRFPNPPTYVWNPKDENAKLDAKKLKDSLKVRLPKLVWSERSDGVEIAEMEFPDMTYAELAVGQDADHLTITYHIEGSE